jgi:hypothetical protein
MVIALEAINLFYLLNVSVALRPLIFMLIFHTPVVQLT